MGQNTICVRRGCAPATLEVVTTLQSPEVPLGEMKKLRQKLLRMRPTPVEVACILDCDARAIEVVVTLASQMSNDALLSAIGTLKQMAEQRTHEKFGIDCSGLAH